VSDGLSQLLLRLSVSSSVYCRTAMTAPWGFKLPAVGVPAFHLVVGGSAWLEVEGLPRQVELSGGDLVILPRGDAHAVRDRPTSPVRWLNELVEATPAVEGWVHHGGGGEPSELLCGGFAIERIAVAAVVEALPRLVHLRGGEGGAPEWLAELIGMIAKEMSRGGPGSEAVVARLTDALLAHALRYCLLESTAARQAPVGAITDERLARVLKLIHEHPERAWTVSNLATAAVMSRSAFAEKFRAAVGESPMRHLARYRLNRAAEYLRTTKSGLLEIARLTGYRSDVSLSKAFHRQFGASPGSFRRGAG
jgi:AraC family transcriptional regulator, alkane utilization regulator